MKRPDDWIGKEPGDAEKMHRIAERMEREIERRNKMSFGEYILEDFKELVGGLGSYVTATFVAGSLFLLTVFLIYEGNRLSQHRRICEYQDGDKNGLYERYRIIKTTPAKSDTSEASFIEFATQFDGQIRRRELSQYALENVFREYHWPEVDEIRFKD